MAFLSDCLPINITIEDEICHYDSPCRYFRHNDSHAPAQNSRTHDAGQQPPPPKHLALGYYTRRDAASRAPCHAIVAHENTPRRQLHGLSYNYW